MAAVVACFSWHGRARIRCTTPISVLSDPFEGSLLSKTSVVVRLPLSLSQPLPLTCSTSSHASYPSSVSSTLRCFSSTV
jgi:hypothetical protein